MICYSNKLVNIRIHSQVLDLISLSNTSSYSRAEDTLLQLILPQAMIR